MSKLGHSLLTIINIVILIAVLIGASFFIGAQYGPQLIAKVYGPTNTLHTAQSDVVSSNTGTASGGKANMPYPVPPREPSKQLITSATFHTIGVASMKVEPDIAIVNILITAEDKNADYAVNLVKEYMGNLQDVLGDYKVEFNNMSVMPKYRYIVNTSILSGYKASVYAKVRIDVSKLSDVLNKITKLDQSIVRIQSINFQVSNIEEIKNKLLTQAINDALKKARAMAYGVEEVDSYEFLLKEASYQQFHMPIYPVYKGDAYAEEPSFDINTLTPQTISITVNTTWKVNMYKLLPPVDYRDDAAPETN